MIDLLTPIAGRYQLRSLVGHGGMGRVWRADDLVLGREVAVKEVVPPHWLSPGERDKLRDLTIREARAAAKLNHEHVIRVYDVVEQDDWPWIVMEYVPSESLHHVIEHSGPLDPLPAAMIGLALLDALTAAHQAGVLHRDVKPLNVLLGQDGRIVLTDFGLATFTAEGTVTHGTVLGSPQFVAPERAMYGRSSIEADLWSLGATLYTAVEGRSPYARDSVMATLAALATQPPDRSARAGPLQPVLNALLRRDPAERADPESLRRMLIGIIEGAPPALPARPPRRRSRALVAIVVIGLLSLPGERMATAQPQQATATTSVDGYAEATTCATAPKTTDPVDGTPTMPGTAFRLMDGWSWFAGSRFAIAVPSTWERWRSGDVYCFQDRLGGRVLGVHSQPGVTAADVAGRAMQSARHTLAGYRLIGMSTLHMAQPATSWEFAYSRNGYEHRAVVLFITSPSGVDTVFWTTDALEFQPSQAYFDVVRGSYTPLRP